MDEHYSQIDFAERRRIQDMRDAKMPMTAIAEVLGRHRSTIHREIRRNFYHDPFRDRWGQEYKGYFCTSAERDARNRRSPCRMKLTLKPHPVAVEPNADDVLEGGYRLEHGQCRRRRRCTR